MCGDALDWTFTALCILAVDRAVEMAQHVVESDWWATPADRTAATSYICRLCCL